MGWVSFANQTGQVVASCLGGWLADRLGWSAPFAASAGVAALGGLLAAAVRERERPSSRHTPVVPVALLRLAPALRIASVLGIFAQVASSSPRSATYPSTRAAWV
ncbi:MAG: MFS transporter [Actinomycetia bacterium]|nr:MFS transporter [Actinomycetes bacterium]